MIHVFYQNTERVAKVALNMVKKGAIKLKLLDISRDESVVEMRVPKPDCYEAFREMKVSQEQKEKLDVRTFLTNYLLTKSEQGVQQHTALTDACRACSTLCNSLQM